MKDFPGLYKLPGHQVSELWRISPEVTIRIIFLLGLTSCSLANENKLLGGTRGLHLLGIEVSCQEGGSGFLQNIVII